MGNIFGLVFKYLRKVTETTASQVLIFLGPGLVLALVMYLISGIIRSESVLLFGARFWIYFTAPGTIIHELGHALFAVLFGHKIVAINLFGPDPATGTLGYVSHAYNENSLYQRIGNFFIGIGPILLGSMAIAFSSRYLVGSGLYSPLKGLNFSNSTLGSAGDLWGFVQEVLKNASQIIKMLFQPGNFSRWQFYIFLYIVFSVGAHTMLSPADIRGAWDGFIFLVGTLFALNLLTLWMRDFAKKYTLFISQLSSFFYAVMFFTIVLNLALIAIFAVFVVIKRIIR
jgi:hypothetical protein